MSDNKTAADQMMDGNPKYRIAVELWAIYYFMTETFDRKVCTGPMKDGWIMPANNIEARKCSENAESVRLSITTVSVKEEVSAKDFVAGMEEAKMLNFEACQGIAWNSSLYTRVQTLYIGLNKFASR